MNVKQYYAEKCGGDIRVCAMMLNVSESTVWKCLNGFGVSQRIADVIDSATEGQITGIRVEVKSKYRRMKRISRG